MKEDFGNIVTYRRESLEAMCSSISHTILVDDVYLELHCKFLENGVSHRPREKRHRHPTPPFSRLFLFTEGQARIITDTGEHIMRTGVLHLLPARMPFDVIYDPSVLYYFHLHVYDRSGVAIHAELDAAREIDRPELFSRICRAVESGDASSMHLYVFEAITLFAECVKESLLQRARCSGRFGSIIRYIQENPTATLNIDDLAEQIGMSRSALSKGFRRSVGVSLKDYITSMRLRKAQELLIYTDRTVLQIADELGYTHAGYFHRVFRRLTGKTPTSYRQSLRG